VSQLQYPGRRDCCEWEQKKKKVCLSLTPHAKAALKAMAMSEGCYSISNLLENIARYRVECVYHNPLRKGLKQEK
jgi:peptide deformylase